MAINKIAAPLSTGPSVFAQPVLNQLAALLTDCNHGNRVSGGYVKACSLWNIGGSMFLADSDTAITGTRSSSTTGIKFTVSGSTATASYGTDTPTWNASYQGYYDGSGNYYYIGSIKAGDFPFPATGVQETLSTTAGPYKAHYTSFVLYISKDSQSSTAEKVGCFKVQKAGIYRLNRIMSIGDSTTGVISVYLNGNSFISSTIYASSTTADDIFIEDEDELEIYVARTSGKSYASVIASLSIGNFGAIQS